MSVSRSAGLGVLVFSLLSELPGVKCQYLGQQGLGRAGVFSVKNLI